MTKLSFHSIFVLLNCGLNLTFTLVPHMREILLIQVLEPVVHRDFVYNQFEPLPESNFFTLSSYVTRELYARLEKIVNKYKVSVCCLMSIAWEKPQLHCTCLSRCLPRIL